MKKYWNITIRNIETDWVVRNVNETSNKHCKLLTGIRDTKWATILVKENKERLK